LSPNVIWNTKSTQIQDEYDEVWGCLKREMRPRLTGAYRVAFATEN
jgi:hypothetical protein